MLQPAPSHADRRQRQKNFEALYIPTMSTPTSAESPGRPVVGLEVAAAAAAAAAARSPQRITLEGRLVSLQPLSPAHAHDLFEGAGGEERASLWDYLPDGPFASRQALRDAVARKAQSSDPLFFAILDRASGHALGHAALMRADCANRVIEVGNVLFAPRLQRSAGATECMYLLARYVFDDLGYRRYEWKCDDLNAPSKRAALRLGFSWEGLFRQHMIVKGRNRDTAWFSMLDTEWPALKRAFQAWIAPANFDEQGRQRSSLAALRSGSVTSTSA